MSPLVGVIGLVVVLLVLLGVGVLLLQRLRRGAAEAGAALAAELEADPPTYGPEAVHYAGGHGVSASGRVPFGRLNGILVLTSTRLLFREVNGSSVAIDVAHIGAVRLAEEYDGVRPPPPRPKRSAAPLEPPLHLVVSAADCTVGFVVDDPEAWRRAITGSAPPSS